MNNMGPGPGMPIGMNNMGPGGIHGQMHNRGGMMSPMAHASMGGLSPMGNMNNPNMSPMGGMSPMSGHGMGSMGPGRPMSGSPMNPNSIGSPMNSMPGIGSPMGNTISRPNAMGMYGGPKPMPVSAGKIYPSDQPMVFNPQNPNAPPIYPCGVCHKEVHDNDQGLLCESGCNFWFHRACSGLTEAAYQLIHNEVYAEWCCDKCLSSKNIPLVKFKP
ncbi:unnamed protein product [Diamesa hyperborea]